MSEMYLYFAFLPQFKFKTQFPQPVDGEIKMS